MPTIHPGHQSAPPCPSPMSPLMHSVHACPCTQPIQALNAADLWGSCVPLIAGDAALGREALTCGGGPVAVLWRAWPGWVRVRVRKGVACQLHLLKRMLCASLKEGRVMDVGNKTCLPNLPPASELAALSPNVSPGEYMLRVARIRNWRATPQKRTSMLWSSNCGPCSMQCQVCA